ncbi:MAG: cyclic nucleotide-binding domain-containing protein [Syntrophobacterales bacterium]|nr:MAG: cyclic nucleotide-binding domain-containing protein [Syntrophobacterales bacterium]
MASIEVLKKVNLFESLSDDQLNAIAKLGQEKSFEPGEEIFKQGQKSKTLYVLLDGMVTLRIKAEEEIDLMAETLRETGSVFGTASLMKPYISNVTARCLKPSRTLAVDSAEFQEIIKQDPLMGFEVMTKLAQLYFNRLNTTRAAITNLFKIFKFQIRKSKIFDTYGELK